MTHLNDLKNIKIKSDSVQKVPSQPFVKGKVFEVKATNLTVNVSKNNNKAEYHLIDKDTDSISQFVEFNHLAVIKDEITESLLCKLIDSFLDLMANDSLYVLEITNELDLNVVVFLAPRKYKGMLEDTCQELSRLYHFDYFFPKDNLPTLNQPGLLVMDMDSTAIEIECIDEIAKLYGVGQAVSLVTERAMRGELDFSESLRERVGQLKGANQAILESVKQNLPLMPGLEELVSKLKEHDWKIVIASGGFTFFADYLKQRLGLYATYANQLEITDGVLTGQLNGNIVDSQFKADILEELSIKLSLPKRQTVAIGDGANDLPMLKKATLGVAYHAKPSVQEACEYRINYSNLKVLYVILVLATRSFIIK